MTNAEQYLKFVLWVVIYITYEFRDITLKIIGYLIQSAKTIIFVLILFPHTCIAIIEVYVLNTSKCLKEHCNVFLTSINRTVIVRNSGWTILIYRNCVSFQLILRNPGCPSILIHYFYFTSILVHFKHLYKKETNWNDCRYSIIGFWKYLSED